MSANQGRHYGLLPPLGPKCPPLEYPQPAFFHE